MTALSPEACALAAALADPELQSDRIFAADHVWRELRDLTPQCFKLQVWNIDDDEAGVPEPDIYYNPDE